MATYKTKAEAKAALQKARQNLYDAKQSKNKKLYAKYMKECKDLQHILDRWF